jgi:CRISPR/Cas system CMR subunit Cmr4 (Cas7 group RAMP superfamily)
MSGQGLSSRRRVGAGEVVAVKFTIVFHTPFRVATGRAGDGSDSVVDPTMPLPASSLKGVMRAAARDLLGVSEQWVKLVYGWSQLQSPWSWSDAVLTAGNGQPLVRPRARIQIDPDTGTVAKGALGIADEVLAKTAEFRVDRAGYLTAEHREHHQTILVASARAVTGLGGSRRRGLGWVSIVPLDPPWPAEEDQALTAGTALAEALTALPTCGGDQ